MSTGVTLSTAARNAACDAIVDLLDGGSGDASGDLEVYSSTPTKLAELTFSATAFGAASTGTATANTITSDSSADASGTPDYVVCRNKSNTEIFRLGAGVGSGTVNFSSAISAGAQVSITSLTLTVPAGTIS